MKCLLAALAIGFVACVAGCPAQPGPPVVRVWGNVESEQSDALVNKTSLKRNVYDLDVKGKIGGNPWTKRQRVPGKIATVEHKKVRESHRGTMCSYTTERLKDNLIKVTVHFCGTSGKTATGTLRVVVYYE